MLFDVLTNIDNLKICVNYELDGKIIDYIPASLSDYSKCKPIYKTFKKFNFDQNIKSFDELPVEAKEYISFIEEYTGVKIGIISIGSDRNATIIK